MAKKECVKRLFRMVHDAHVLGLEGHHYSLAAIQRCSQQGVFLPGTIFREGRTLWRLTRQGMEVVREGLERGVNQKLLQQKLSPEEVTVLRYRHRENHERIVDLAREYNVSPQHTSNMVKGRRR